MSDPNPQIKTATASVAKPKIPTGTGEGFDLETEKPLGVDPETDELLSVVPSGLKVLYGLNDDEADALYCKIAGVNHGSVFFSPGNEAASYRPPINISNPDLDPKVRAKIDKILSAPKG